MVKVLVTGGSGFIAAHILEQLLEKGHSVVTTVRSEAKAQGIREAYKDLGSERLEVAIVPDIAVEGAFDEVVKTPGIEVVMHTASPFHFNWTDPQKELVDPALIGTTSIIKALHRSAPSVKRLIVTASFACIIDEAHLADPFVYTEATWNPVTSADIHRSPATAYRLSKKLAEKAAWDFVADEKPTFDLVTVCPPLVLGPVVHRLASLESINTSNERVVALLRGQWRDEIPPTGAAWLWIDVRDVAAAHVRAMEVPEAGGKRLFTTAGYFCHKWIADAVRKNFPEYQDRLPTEDTKGGEFPKEGEVYKFDTTLTDGLLGIEWIGLEKSIVDLVKSLKAFGI